MEEENIIESNFCSFCKESIESESVFCLNCGYPENGTEKDVAQFYGRRAMQKNKNIDAEEKIKSARTTLYVIAGATLVFGLIFYFSNKDLFTLATNFVVFFIYLLLASWSTKKPLMALLLGLLLYLTTIILSAIVDPSSLVRGVLWKVIIIFYLGKGIYSASSIKDVKPSTIKKRLIE